MSNFLKKIVYLIIGLILFIGVFTLGIYVGFSNRPEIDKITGVNNKENPPILQVKADFFPFWKVWNVINDKNPDALKISDQDKIYGAIQGLASSLNDPYTVFFPPSKDKMFKESVSGEFGGVGMEVGIKDKILVVIAPLKDTPAYKVGIKPGDKIIKIDATSTTDINLEEAIWVIRGEIDTVVKLTILREGITEPIELNITRARIQIPTIDTEIKEDVFVIHLYNFSTNSPELFKNALDEFDKSGLAKMIIDLRGNPGGFLDAAVDITSWFLPAGKIIVTEDFGIKKDPIIYRSKGYDIFTDKLRLAILIDGGSASASEILAGALHDYNLATIVGEKSFGKGSVQELVSITPDTSLKITVAKWLTPNGVSISEKGVVPDYEVKISQEDFEKKIDAQMDKALEILK